MIQFVKFKARRIERNQGQASVIVPNKFDIFRRKSAVICFFLAVEALTAYN